MTIPGGYILLPRCIDQSELMNEAPITRELWLYILRNVSHSEKGNLKRGSGFFTYEQIRMALGYYVGYRYTTYTKDRIAKSIRRLRESDMIATTKATRGIIITVCKYDYYQNPKNYEGNYESNTKAMPGLNAAYTINKNGKNKESEYRDNHTTDEILKIFQEFKADSDTKFNAEAEALRFYNKYSSLDWKINGSSITDPRGLIKNWIVNIRAIETPTKNED